MSYRILLVEDDEALRETVTDYLTAKGQGTMEIISAKNCAEGEKWAAELKFDLALLDVMLPDGDGFSLCRVLRQEGDMPLMFLTARAMEEDKLRGFSLGCDDYLVKPFSLAELFVRVKALLRRSGGESMEVLSAGNVELTPKLGRVTVNGENLELTRREYQVLKYLMEHKNHVVTRDALLDGVWGMDFEGNDRVVDNHIRKLRKALGKEARIIRTMIGVGYRLEEKP